MFNFFRKNNKKKKSTLPPFVDLNNNPLQEGDLVISLRYDLGKCIIKSGKKGFFYESLKSGERVSWIKMIDAATENQKVQKIIEKQEAKENN